MEGISMDVGTSKPAPQTDVADFFVIDCPKKSVDESAVKEAITEINLFLTTPAVYAGEKLILIKKACKIFKSLAADNELPPAQKRALVGEISMKIINSKESTLSEENGQILIKLKNIVRTSGHGHLNSCQNGKLVIIDQFEEHLDENNIQEALEKILLFLQNPLKSSADMLQSLPNAAEISRHAVTRLEQLTNEQRDILAQISPLLGSQPIDKFNRDQMQMYRLLIQIFAEITPNLLNRAELVQAGYQFVPMPLPGEDLAVYDKKRLLNISTIQNFFQQVHNHYLYPLIETNETLRSLNLILDHSSFPLMVSEQFYHQPHDMPELQKNITLACLKEVNNFLTHYLIAYQSISTSFAAINHDFSKLSPQEQEIFIVKRMNYQLANKNRPMSVSEDGKIEDDMRACSQCINGYITKLLDSDSAVNPGTKAFLLNAVSVIAAIAAEESLHPYYTAVLFNTITEKGVLADVITNQKLPGLDNFNADDLIFSETCGRLIGEISKKAIEGLGEPKGVTWVIAKGLNAVFSLNENNIGNKFQQFMNRTTNQECQILPIQIFQSLLFDISEKQEFTPKIKKKAKLSEAEIAAYIAQSRIGFPARFYEFILDILPGFLSTGIKAVGSSQDFIHTIAERVFSIGQQRKVLRLLFVNYLMHGIIEELVIASRKEKEAAQSM